MFKRKMVIIAGVIGFILIYLINYTNIIDPLMPKVKYVRLKNGQEFRDVTMRCPGKVDVVIDGKWYTQYDIDSLVR